MKTFLNFALAITIAIAAISNNAQADCLSKYDRAFKNKRTLFEKDEGKAAKIGDYVISLPIGGIGVGVVSCAIGCLLAGTLAPLAIWSGAGIAAGAVVALAIPVKMAIDGSIDLGKVRKTIRQAKEFQLDASNVLKNPLKKVVKRALLENPNMSPLDVANAIIDADQKEIFCSGDLGKFRELDDLAIVE